jgi:hypothetical protein
MSNIMYGSNNFSGSKNYGGPRDSGPREMTKVTCSDQYIAGIACRNTGNPGSDFKNLSIFLIFLPSLLLLASCAVCDVLIRIIPPFYRRYLA